jgi:molybdopterin-guanine dinucleotide biosynthesis protein A
MTKVAGFVAAGGRSSRMGSDKAWLDLGGRPIIQWVIDAMRPVVSSLAVIANDPRYDELGLKVYRDTNLDVGPLEAIRTALANNSDHPRVLIVACDLPMVTSALFEFLLSLEDDDRAIVPVGPDSRLEPLCAVYPGNALHPVTELIAGERRMVRELFDAIPTRLVPFDEVRHLDGAEWFFANVNSPADLSRVMDLTQSRTSSRNVEG